MTFEDLVVWQNAHQFVLAVYRGVTNAQRSTSNFQRPSGDSSSLGVGRWALDVRCPISVQRPD
jgi:hypothetical protein